MRLQHRLLKRPRRRQHEAGFSLAELLIAASLGVGVAILAGDAMLSHIRSGERLEALERQRSEWSRTSNFIEAEVALSERIVSDEELVSKELCSTASESDSSFLFALDLRRDLPLAIYFSRPNPNTTEWVGDRTLWRCGPTINADGSFGDLLSGSSSSVSEQVLVDGLTDACSLKVATDQPAVAKSLKFELCIQGLSRRQYKQSAHTYSRVSPVFSFPSITSLCSSENLRIEGFYRLGGGTSGADTLEVPTGAVPSNTDVLICGYGGGDTIIGSTANDVLEAGEIGPGATVIGQSGNDRLRGSPAGDALYGNAGDDVLIGLSGNDTLDGGTGENRYLPGTGNDTVRGGPDLDVVFIDKSKADVSGLSFCNRSFCSLSFSDGGASNRTTMRDVEVLIFRDGRVDLPGGSINLPGPVG